MRSKYFKLIRITNWIKNVFILLPLVFSTQLQDSTYWLRIFLTILAFSFASSFIYIINDIVDKNKDALHPVKKLRPIASGEIGITRALLIGLFLLSVSLLIMSYLSISLLQLLGCYLVLNIAYSFYLKKISIVDCISISMGFVLRVLVGCAAIHVTPSDWILATTFFLALYLAFSKRKSELVVLKDQSGMHRSVLNGYSIKMLDTYMIICAVTCLTAYLFYSFDFRVVNTFHNDNLKYSVVFVVTGFFRYFQIQESNVYKDEGDPTALVLKDKPLQIVILLWLSYTIWVIYG
ncbi:MAG: decaprenyl-phosphate phosphoribosyltransferase [Bacteroidia bacterium]|jgi:4-hydroxybenzoate polyprenyltransferase|nr:decaprenyl-phosphate phosphoribosyltransferase [Bacteroidia bacterium]